MSGMALARTSNDFKFNLLTGTTADTNIAVTGISTSDEIVWAGHFTTAAALASLADDTANCSVTSAGNIQSATDTSNDQLLLVWNDITAGSTTRSATALRFNILTGTTADTNIAVSGATTEDQILFVGHFSTAATIATLEDDTENCSFTSDGNLQSATDTSNDALLLIWNDLGGASTASARNAMCLQVSVLAGAAAETNITVTGAVTTDEILWCGHATTAAEWGTLADITSECSFTSDGNLQLDTTATTSDALWLWWNKLTI